MSEMELDPGLLQDFITEAAELLEEYTASLTAFEEDPKVIETINPVFRAAHTLKGSSAFFGLTHIKDFAHKLENLLDDIRHQTRTADSRAIEYLFLAGNHLKAMFERLAAGNLSPELTPDEAEFQADLVAWMAATGGGGGAGGGAADFEGACRKIKALLMDALENPRDPSQIVEEIMEMISRLPLELKSPAPEGAAGADKPDPAGVSFLGVDLSGPALSALGNIKSEHFDPRAYGADLQALQALVAENGWDGPKKPLDEAEEDFTAIRDSGLDFDPVLTGLLRNKYQAFLETLDLAYPEAGAGGLPKDEAAAGEAPGEAGAPASSGNGAQKGGDPQRESKTMRISEEKVDGFMSYVGELIVTAETFNYLQKMIEQDKVNPNTVRAFKNANQAFRELSDELQESLMEIRRVPIKGILQKVNMMARELSHQLGKKVRVQLEGQEVQLDKSIAESLEAPLVHVVRNSLDHGFEAAGDRTAQGKNEECLLKVSASADKEYFYLVVEDDGRGIDPDKMRAVAVEKGYLSETQAAALTEKEAIGLIFGAGFSTARTITDVSGRGVGMDVVRTNISALNGSINIDSVVGQGTAITLKIPLSVTLQVIKALHVRVGQANFIISLDEILESLRPMPEELSTVEGRGLVLNRRGSITPLIKLYEIFNLEPQHSRPEDGLVVMVETPVGRYALLVDAVMGQQQVVVKELGAQFKRLSFLSGSALLGDGGLGLVLDAGGVVNLAFGLG
ncbi:MAG: chemotaxis protein CheA [Candidatus Adiutrix sp.]|jgi:two-component system chemotaxis sensor kinase CheA|nr:chemotaxis protein CheA [Candidatus Adiutrix sp.]